MSTVGNVDRLDELNDRCREFAIARDWLPFQTPKNLSMALAGEVGELLAELQWLTPEQSTTVMTDPDLGPRVRAEIGDVVIYLMRLTDTLGVDPIQAAHAKLDDSARRYTVEEYRGVARKAPPTNEAGA